MQSLQNPKARELLAAFEEYEEMARVEIQPHLLDTFDDLVLDGRLVNGNGPMYRVASTVTKPVIETVGTETKTEPRKVGRGRAPYREAGSAMRESQRLAVEAKLTAYGMRVWSALVMLLGSYSKLEDRIPVRQIATAAFPEFDPEGWGKRKVAEKLPEVIASGAIIDLGDGRYALPQPKKAS